MKQRELTPSRYQFAPPHATTIPHELIPLLPANWPVEIPLARITTCGPTVSIEVLRQIHPDTETDGHPTLVYGPPDAALLEEKGASTALLLLAVLASQPHCSATKDWLSETLGHGTYDEDEDDLDERPGLKRVDNVATQLRHLLFPPVLRDLPTANQLRRRLVISYRATRESGSGYRLAGLPLLWIDVEAIGEHLKQARALDQFGHDGLPAWQAAYEVAGRGIFLEREPYSDWASWRRQQVETQLWQSVQALWRPLANQGEAGETEAVRILQSYWQNHITNEDVLRPLIELLGKRECYGQAEEYYAHLCLALEEEGKQPDQRTQETMTFLRALQIQRQKQEQAPSRKNLVEGHHSPSSSLLLEANASSLSTGGDDTLERKLARSQYTSKIDWGEAPSPQQFYGRTQELAILEAWIVEQRCRLIAIVGMGGIGKTSLASVLIHGVKDAFEYVFWRSLQHAPLVHTVLEECLKFLSDQQQTDFPEDCNDLVLLLLKKLREHRCLLVLDNCETVIQSGVGTGSYRDDYEEYSRLFRQLGEMEHQSCLVLTSREKPREIALLEGENASVHSHHLSGLKLEEGITIIQDKGLVGGVQALEMLVASYAGNPLALKLVSQFIYEVFQGEITAFLQDGQVIFSDIQEVLDQQVQRLSPLEQEIMYWLAIEREAISPQQLSDDLVHSPTKKAIRAVIQSLRRRSLVEANASGFFLQNVVLEYMTDRFIAGVCKDLQAETSVFLHCYALLQAQSKEYIQESQRRMILQPVVQYLLTTFGKEESENVLKHLLAALHDLPMMQPSYAAGNILNLLLQLGCNLRGWDFSRLEIRQADLQGANLSEVNFAYAHLLNCVFTETFGGILSVAFSPDSKQIAAATTNGEIRLWNTTNATPLLTLQGHTDWVYAVAFSPDGKTLISGSDDQTMRIWEVATGQLIRVVQASMHWIMTVAVSPDGRMMLGAGEDRTLYLWEITTGQLLKTLQDHDGRIWSVAFSPDGKIIASGSEDRSVRLWDSHTGQLLKILLGHPGPVWSVAFSPDGKMLVSSGEGSRIYLWEVDTGQILKELQGSHQGIWSAVFSPDGKIVIAGGDDMQIYLWEVDTGQLLKSLQGHNGRIRSVAWSPDGRTIVTGSEDQSVRLWDSHAGQLLKSFQGYSGWVWSAAFSFDSKRLITGGEDFCIHLWNVQTGRLLHTLRGHTGRVWSIAFSPDGNVVASGSDDQTVLLWDCHTGRLINRLRGCDRWVLSVAFSPDGNLLAAGSGDRTVRIWNVSTGQLLKTFHGHTGSVYSVAFSPDGKTVMSGGTDHCLRLWDVHTGQLFKTFHGHTDSIWSVTFHPDGKTVMSSGADHYLRLWDVHTEQLLKTFKGHTDGVRSVDFSSNGQTVVSGSDDRSVRLWDKETGQLVQILEGHTDKVRVVAFSPNEKMVVSGSTDGTIRLWDRQTGACLKILQSNKLYERMDITGVHGLTTTQTNTLKALGAVEVYESMSIETRKPLESAGTNAP